MSAYKYAFKSASRIKADADKTAQLFKKLESGKGLTAKNVVNASRPKKAVLHNEFEWNDSIAAENYREGQARHIMNSLIIVHSETKESVRHCFPITIVKDDEEVREYHTMEVIANNDEYKQQIIDRAKSELEAFRHKYNMLENIDEFAELFGLIEEMTEVAV